MDRDLLGSVAELTHRLRREQATLARALAHGRGVGDGTDETGSITIVLDDEGTARDIVVAADWRRRLPPTQIGAAVVAADGAAAQRRATATAEALAEAQASTEDSWSGDDGRQSSDDAEPPGVAAAGPGGRGWLAPVPAADAGQPRSLADLSTAVLAAFDDLERVTEPHPPVQGAGGDGAVQVTLDRGRITACTVNQAWLGQQDEVTLTHGLREAICAAATAGLAARRPLIEYQQRLDAIIADAHQTLAEISRGPRR